MAAEASGSPRVRVDGKFFRLGSQKFYVKGVTYGPLIPHPASAEPFASPERTRRDLAAVRELGANVLRVYDVPPPWFLQLVEEQDLKVILDIPWNTHTCVVHSERRREQVRGLVREAVEKVGASPALFAFSVANEIPPDLVRWSGSSAMADWIDELVSVVKEVRRDCLCTFGNFPSTEFLRPQDVDFLCFNVYLHEEKAWTQYLARLQMIADPKPLIVGEMGVDSIREGQNRQAGILSWQIETAFRSGVAGTVVYSFTDEWFKGGQTVPDWAFGLTTAGREPKPAFAAVQQAYAEAPHFPLTRYPRVSVVVASYQGERTLTACLQSLTRLRYPDYEVILVDDGSTDSTAQLTRQFPQVQALRHSRNLGLSTARNTGIQAASGEIIAFTDSDCRADEDWLYYLVGDLLDSEFVGVGGHNLLPPEDTWIAAAVMVSPGGPAHVMLTDRVAEHIPGCNMAFYKWALDQIGGFDPLFRRAGDDVDVCWRLQQQGHRIGFSPGGFVWHYRRATVRDYLRQQQGYGEAEALLVYRHPEYFNWLGASRWRGRIYSQARVGISVRPSIVYHGVFGSGYFQSLYSAPPALHWMVTTSLEYHVLLTLPFVILSTVSELFLPLAVTTFALSVLVCIVAALQADLPKGRPKIWSRPLVALLFFLQPIVRGWARYRGRLTLPPRPLSQHETLSSLSKDARRRRFEELSFWSSEALGRVEFLAALWSALEQKGWTIKTGAGWSDSDIEIHGSRWNRLRLTTASEVFGRNRRMIRCRLQTKWTFFSATVFFVLLGLEMLVIGVLTPKVPWIWSLLLTLLPFVWWLDKEQENLRRVAGVFLSEVAQHLGLTLVETPDESDESAPSTNPDAPA